MGTDNKKTTEPSKTVIYAAVVDGSDLWHYDIPTVRTVGYKYTVGVTDFRKMGGLV